MASSNTATITDPPVHIKIAINGKDETRKFKLNLKDCCASVLPDKVCPVVLIDFVDKLEMLSEALISDPLRSRCGASLTFVV